MGSRITPSIVRSVAINVGLLLVMVAVFFFTADFRARGHAFSEVLTLFLLSVIIAAALFAFVMAELSRKTRAILIAIFGMVFLAGLIPMFIWDFSGPVFVPPPYYLSVPAAGVLLAIVTTEADNQ